MNEKQQDLHAEHKLSDFIYWATFFLIPIIIGSVAIIRRSFWSFLLYLLIFAGAFLGLWYQFFCPGCPHYKKSKDKCKCMFIWGLPRFYPSKNRAYKRYEIALGFLGLALILVYPLFWLYYYPFLLIMYLLIVGIFIITLHKYECTRCTHYDCPLNKAPNR